MPDTHTAASVSRADVLAAYALCASGDTLAIPAGDEAWASVAVFTIGLNVVGAGKGVTVIRSATGNAISTRMIQYIPADPSLNEAFSLSHMTLDGQDGNAVLLIKNTSATDRLTKIRLHHLDFPNEAGYFMEVRGHIDGVMDNCSFNGLPHIDFYGWNSAWDNFAFNFGSASQFYVEDCAWVDCDNVINTCGIGGRVCFRHNEFWMLSNILPLHDMHGNQPGGNAAGMGFECYENTYHLQGYGTKFIDMRGGKSLVYNNTLLYATSAPYANYREEYDDSLGVGPAARFRFV
jgi:hypothetical protein